MLTTTKKIFFYVVVLALLAEQVWVFGPAVKSMLFPPHEDVAQAGAGVALRMGCPACHGAAGGGGFDNPGSENGVVPALSGGEMMMWADEPEHLREWILYGRRLDDESLNDRSGFTAGQGSARAVVMPAYEPFLASGELEQLVAWLGAISGLQFPDAPASAPDEEKQRTARVADGLELAHRLGCFSCHGPMGTGGVQNPGSLKGYVPGFFGEDYAELVADNEELREWISDAAVSRLLDNPLARRVLESQALKMPSYGDFLEDEEIDSLVELVAWLASDGWREMPVP
ncbi:MAG TPA: hypothetical protein EYG16_11365 [Deltaproteobacteria bacterium]|nr:hypothetical protein [Candidatus Binatota bacterium]HIL14256.1 hypothetical protein [Deltaproteobacteria bacterium]